MVGQEPHQEGSVEAAILSVDGKTENETFMANLSEKQLANVEVMQAFYQKFPHAINQEIDSRGRPYGVLAETVPPDPDFVRNNSNNKPFVYVWTPAGVAEVSDFSIMHNSAGRLHTLDMTPVVDALLHGNQQLVDLDLPKGSTVKKINAFISPRDLTDDKTLQVVADTLLSINHKIEQRVINSNPATILKNLDAYTTSRATNTQVST